MKKTSIVVVALFVMGGIACASSLAIPWFVDNAPALATWPPATGATTLIYLKNNTPDAITAEIVYYSANGTNVGPAVPDNDFVIPAFSSVAFRPVVNDTGGQESTVAALIPDRPRPTDPLDPSTTQKNGSATVSWVGGPSDIQGFVATCASNMSYAHLLPPGN